MDLVERVEKRLKPDVHLGDGVKPEKITAEEMDAAVKRRVKYRAPGQ